ncbi:MAG: DUF4136 domain-containing protein [Motiliproteus sp.]
MTKYILTALITLSLAGCNALAVSTNHDPYAKFSDYKSFDWMKESKLGDGKPNPKRDLLVRQLQFVLERELKAKGVQKQTKSPDILIGYYGHKEDRSNSIETERANYWGTRDRYDYYQRTGQDLGSRYVPPKPVDRGGYTRTYETQTIEYSLGTLIIDFFDAKSKQIIWSATLQGILDKQDLPKQLEQGLVDAIKKFPPKK